MIRDNDERKIIKIDIASIRKKTYQKSVNIIMTGRESKEVIILKENIYLNSDFIVIGNGDINNKILGNDSRYDLYIQVRDNGERHRIKGHRDKKSNKYIDLLVDDTNKKYCVLYYTKDNGISFEVTKNIGYAMTKCKKMSYELKDMSNNKSYIYVKRNFNIDSMKFVNKKLDIVFDDNVDFKLVDSVNIYLQDRKSKDKYYFRINKYDIKSDKKISINISDFIKNHTNNKRRLDLYLEYTDNKILAVGRIGLYEKKEIHQSKRYLEAKECYDNVVLVPYITEDNGISFMINTYTKYVNEKYNPYVSVKNVSVNKYNVKVQGEFSLSKNLDYKIESVLFTLRNKTKDTLDYNIDVKSKKISDGYKYEFEIDVLKYKFEQFYWDLYLIINVNNELIKVRVKNISSKAKHKIDNKVIKYTMNLDNNYILYPYVTVNDCLSFTFRQRGEYEAIKYKIKEFIAQYIYRSTRLFLDSKDTWLIYEKYSETAQDNSFYFFKYCYENHPERNVYYVINKNSPDYKNVEPYKDRVVDFMSIKHLLLICSSKLLIASESRAHAYAWKVQRGYIKNKLADKKMVFLQHGVIALKRIDNGFKKNSPNGCDLFIVSSNYEKEIIKEYFKYNDKEILVNGLARWDVLEDKSKKINSKEIFFMPTWRNWLEEVPQDEFEKSNYFKNYIELLNSERLAKTLKKNNITINYFVHPKFKYYIDKFSSNCENIKVIQPGDIQVNELLMRASLLITDYSSVAWEMYYQNKPTLFYHFDLDEYNKYQGSYIDMDNELFGDSASNADELIDYIERYISTGFKHPEKYEKMRNEYFAHIDDKNCERTYKNIIKNQKKLYKNLSKREIIIRKLRKNTAVKKYWRRIKNNEKIGNNVVALKSKVFKKLNIERKIK